MTPYEVAQAILDKTVSLLDDPPTRQYVSPGVPPHDCDQVVSFVRRVFPSKRPSAQDADPIKHATIPQAEICVEVARCVPLPDENGDPPPVAELEAAGEQHANDLWVLFFGLAKAHIAKELLPGGCRLVAFGGSSSPSEEPRGGMIAARICLTVEVP